MFDQLKNLSGLMKNASAIREHVENLQKELDNRTVEGEAGGGAVRVVMTGRARVVRVDVDQNLMAGIAGDDKAVAEELIASAFNAAIAKVQETLMEELRKATGGMDIPGLANLLSSGTDESGDSDRTRGST